MSGRKKRYNWASYYAAAYEKQRKANIVLAGKIADTERREADLADNLNRIYASPFWKALSLLRRGYHVLKGGVRRPKNTGGSSGRDSCLLRYNEELSRQKHPYLEWIRENDSMCYNKDAIAVNGWQAMQIPDTDIMVLVYGKGMLAADAFYKIKTCFNNNTSCKIAYGDEDFYWEDLSGRMQPWFKPCYSPDTMLAWNYWGHMVAAKADILSGVLVNGELRSRSEHAAHAVRFYDLCLCLEEAVMSRCRLEGIPMGRAVCHIDGICYHRAYEPSADVLKRIGAYSEKEQRYDAVRQSLIAKLEKGCYLTGAGEEFRTVREAALERRGHKGILQGGQEPGLYHVVYDTTISGRERCARAKGADMHIAPDHVVSVIIPSKDHPEVLARCLKSFRDRTEYRCYEWIVVDNGSNAVNRGRMEELRQEYGFTYLYEEMPFNFSKMCNMGAAQAKGDLFLFMNDDIEIIEYSWLRRMAGQALQPCTGAVGAKLWYADTQNIQHAGITNMEIGPSHKLVTFPDDRDYYYGHNRVVYNMIGVTAACLMVARSKFEEVGGFDETMAVAYNDVDFCFKLVEAGLYNVQRNDVVLYHHESLSRGLDEQDGDKWDRLLAEKERLYDKHPQMKGQDMFYHRALIDNASDYGCNYKFPYEEHLQTMEVEREQQELTQKVNMNCLQLTVDRAEIQHKIHKEEPDILWIMGWCYVPGADNAVYKKQVLLKAADGEGYCAVPALWHREDVEAILPEECNVGLAGFVLRVRREDLVPGTYRIGMLCTNEVNQEEKLLAWSDRTCEI